MDYSRSSNNVLENLQSKRKKKKKTPPINNKWQKGGETQASVTRQMEHQLSANQDQQLRLKSRFNTSTAARLFHRIYIAVLL